MSAAGSTQRVTRVAFGVIIAFVLMQALWWVAFQRSYIARTSEARLADWAADAAAAQAAWEAAGRDPALREELLGLQPHLVFGADGFAVDAERVAAFQERQRGYLRMFAWEGPFFVLVVLGMLGLIARSLREERALKKSHQNFLSAVTHEFRTPVATLRLLVETALMRDLSGDRRRDYLRRMASEIDRLERTAEGVLAAARLEEAPLAMTLDPADLREVAARLVEGMRPGLEARGAELELDLPSEPLPVSLDEDAFALVLGNLLDNAVKYTPGERKPVAVRLEARGDLVALHVDDRGAGVPEEERERIFGRFYRAGDESTRAAPGVGLGLHLVKGATEGMNGWIRAEANPDGPGARFSVYLPRRVGGAPADAASAEPPGAEPLRAALPGARGAR